MLLMNWMYKSSPDLFYMCHINKAPAETSCSFSKEGTSSKTLFWGNF